MSTKKINAIAKAIASRNGRLMYVGGYVRDALVGVPNADIDFVVFGVGDAALVDILSAFGDVITAGADFAVTKLRMGGEELDFALARREAPTGAGYHDVVVETGADVTVGEDAARRDLTVNAIYQDVRTGEFVDPFGGRRDIAQRVFRHASARFVESNERPLRLAQMAARYPDFRVAPETVAVCRGMVGQFDRIPMEQLRRQFTKLLVKGRKPGRGLQVLKDIGWLPLFPALAALDETPQNPAHHPEGDALAHTMLVCDAMAAVCDREQIAGQRRFKLMLAALLHDAGKPAVTTVQDNGRIASPGHAHATEAAASFMAQIDVPKKMRQAVLALVREHMAHTQSPTPRSVRRLARRLWDATRSDEPAHSATIEELCFLMEADIRGRAAAPNMANVREIRRLADAEAVQAHPQEPLINGHVLINHFGLNPKKDGRRIGQALAAVRRAQDDGTVSNADEALKIAARELGLTRFTVVMKRLGVTVDEFAVPAPNALTAIDTVMARLGLDPATPSAGVNWVARA